MPNFTYEQIDPADQGMLARIYALGVESQLPPEMGCSTFPHPTMQRIQDAADSYPMYVILADGELRAAIAFDDTGTLQFGIAKPWGSHADLVAGKLHPNGALQGAMIYQCVKDHCDGVVKTYAQPNNAALRTLVTDNDVIVIETSAPGVPTGVEKQYGSAKAKKATKKTTKTKKATK